MYALGYLKVMGGTLGADWNLTNPRAAAWARDRAAWLMTGIDDTSRERLRTLVAALIEADAAVDVASEAIGLAFSDFAGDRADLIARTETATAANMGNLAGFRESATNYVRVYDGEDFDEPCRQADGVIWTIDEAEANPLEHPNCTRSFSAITDEEAASALSEAA